MAAPAIVPVAVALTGKKTGIKIPEQSIKTPSTLAGEEKSRQLRFPLALLRMRRLRIGKVL